MPYLAEKNILFIHIPKNAGKSVELWLGLMTAKEQSSYRWRSYPNMAARWLLVRTRDRLSHHRLFGIIDYPIAAQHLTFQEIQLLELIQRDALMKAFKFAVIRDPWDRALSTFNHMNGGASNFSIDGFERFLSSYFETSSKRHNEIAHKRTQCAFLRDMNGSLAVNEVVRFECLKEDLKRLNDLNEWGFSEIPHVGMQRKGEPYSYYYSAKARTLVARRFEEDIERFEYSFLGS